MDYHTLGFKAGLEVHQQLDTGKLFSRTPSLLREDAPSSTIKRKLRASAGEMGEYDFAALEATKRGNTFTYQAFADSISLVELDEEPPQAMDADALNTILTIAALCNSRVLDSIFVMRKTVVDGSNTSGFQRTALVGIGGSIAIPGKTIGVQAMALEEDSARPMEKKDREIVYRLDRLGIPLIELATDPDCKNPSELKQTAQAIGELFRRTGKAKRGLGSIRQDVNVSIADGARVEIKGVQDLANIDTIAEREVQRQVALLAIKKELTTRGTPQKEKTVDLSSIFNTTECTFLKGKKVYGLKAPFFANLLGKEIQPGRRLGTEIAGYVKAKTTLNGLIHSDELPAYGISEQETEAVTKTLGCGALDGFVFVSGEHKECARALDSVLSRLNDCYIGIPEETRNALEEGNTEYLRPLPGAARMYPETDLAPLVIPAKHLIAVQKHLPLTLAQREKLYAQYGLSGKLIDGLKLSNYAPFFERLANKVNPTTAAVVLIEGVKQLKREGIQGITEEELETILKAEKKGIVKKDILLPVLKTMHSENISIEQAVEKLAGKQAGAGEVKKIIASILDRNAALITERGMQALPGLMGDAMKELRGKADGKVINTVLQSELKKRI
jgi:glutamyl-tRNA(Gln) amidotransferase subunit E